LKSADEYYHNELAQLEKETKALDRVAQKLELELRKAMAAGKTRSPNLFIFLT